jgi:hypothetical protein
MSARMRYLTILAAAALAGCSTGTFDNRNDFKGQPFSAVQSKLGWPDQQETIAGQKVYTWFRGTPLFQCKIRVVMAGDIVESYDTSGDASICSPYDSRPK